MVGLLLPHKEQAKQLLRFLRAKKTKLEKREKIDKILLVEHTANLKVVVLCGLKGECGERVEGKRES